MAEDREEPEVDSDEVMIRPQKPPVPEIKSAGFDMESLEAIGTIEGWSEHTEQAAHEIDLGEYIVEEMDVPYGLDWVCEECGAKLPPESFMVQAATEVVKDSQKYGSVMTCSRACAERVVVNLMVHKALIEGPQEKDDDEEDEA